MGDQRISHLTRPILERGRSLIGGRLFERLRHVTFAGLITLVLYGVSLLEPADQFLWLIQSRISDRSPTGDIVFVGSDEALNDPKAPELRYELSAALDELDRRGVGKVFIDIPFTESSDPKADERLARAIADLGPRVTLVDRIVKGTLVEEVQRTTSPSIAGPVGRVISDQTDRNWLGFAWDLHYDYRLNGKRMRSFAAAMASVDGKPGGKFSVDYGFSLHRIPALPITALTDASAEAESIPVEITGKTIVVGHTGLVPGSQQPMPRSIDAPASYVDIYGAETLKSGRTRV